MIVVSDTSPILNLARIGQLDLLRALYVNVIVPPAVHREFISSLAGIRRDEMQSYGSWLIIKAPVDKGAIDKLLLSLDAGESEAIVLAQELHAEILLVDERKARRIAASLNLKTVGLLGVLVEAKHAGLIGNVKPLLDDLINQARFWIGHDLYTALLSSVDEM